LPAAGPGGAVEFTLAGGPPQSRFWLLQGWLGHRSITSTAVYTALAPNRAAAKKIRLVAPGPAASCRPFYRVPGRLGPRLGQDFVGQKFLERQLVVRASEYRQRVSRVSRLLHSNVAVKTSIALHDAHTP
jgi:hypothetical protein